jgi:hypothetical protein
LVPRPGRRKTTISGKKEKRKKGNIENPWRGK